MSVSLAGKAGKKTEQGQGWEQSASSRTQWYLQTATGSLDWGRVSLPPSGSFLGASGVLLASAAQIAFDFLQVLSEFFTLFQSEAGSEDVDNDQLGDT